MPRLIGLAYTFVLTLLSYSISLLPGFRFLGLLGLSLVIGFLCRLLFGLKSQMQPGMAFASRQILRWGIILLGIRLNFVLLAQVGIKILLIDLLVVFLGLLLFERLGYLFGLSPSLRWLLASGSSICGASAILATAPVVRAKDSEISLAISLVSVLGTLGILGFMVLSHLFDTTTYGIMVGATLQEVGQVLAAADILGSKALDLATLTKMARVALLAPVLLLLSVWMRSEKPHRTASAPLLPRFLLGFLLMGGLNSLALIPPDLVGYIAKLSLFLTAWAMTAVGLGIEWQAIRKVGQPALLTAGLGFMINIALVATLLFW